MSTRSSGKEQLFNPNDILLSITDLDSRIKYANPEFCQIAGFSLEELQGSPHNIVRHPDMPKAAFKDLWTFIQQGKSWMGPVKNRCKNGDYYWVNAYVTPIKDASGKNIEYQSVRTKLDDHVKQRAEKLYQQLNRGEQPFALKYKIDQSFWFQVTFILFFIATLAATLFSTMSLFATLPMLLISLFTTIMYMKWRTRFMKVKQQALEVFDNPLMSYMYSGRNDVLGAIELSLAMRKAEINAVVGRVTDVSIHVSENAKDTSIKSTQVAERLNQQKSESEQVATAINQMSATVHDLARTVAETAKATEHGRELTEQGQQVVKTTVNAINELSTQLSEVDSMITRLAQGSNAITTILTEISSIADQTNLLALNAAIEAARAGEQGRGFAVVAEEVRALAMRTQQSTEEIKDQLQELKANSDNAVNAMIKGNKLSENCVSLSQQTGEALVQIHDEVSLISDSAAQIATAIDEQSMVTEQVSQNVVRINELTIDCEQSSVEATSSSAELLKQLDDQQALIKQFRS